MDLCKLICSFKCARPKHRRAHGAVCLILQRKHMILNKYLAISGDVVHGRSLKLCLEITSVGLICINRALQTSEKNILTLQ